MALGFGTFRDGFVTKDGIVFVGVRGMCDVYLLGYECLLPLSRGILLQGH